MSHRVLLLTLFVLGLCGAIMLPMVPVWHNLTRLLVLAALWQSGFSFNHRPLLVLLGALLLAYIGFWLQMLLASPGSVIIDSVTSIYGMPVSVTADGLLIAFDVVAIGMASYIVYRQINLSAMAEWHCRLQKSALVSLLMFWCWALLTTLAVDITHEGGLAQALAGLSGWSYWLYGALLTWMLVQKRQDAALVLKYCLFSGAGVAALIVSQWLLHDFSYVLDSWHFADYFYRGRGTYYYHTPATFAVLLTGALAFSFYRSHLKKNLFVYAAIAAMFGVCLLNGSRGLSIATLLALWMVGGVFLWKRQWLAVLFCLSFSLFFVDEITYQKPAHETQVVAGIEEENNATLNIDDVVNEKQKNDRLISYSAANHGRMVLYKAGVAELQNTLLLGRGVGTLVLPLQGNSFNGLLSTYSSHMLYLDIAIMGGLPSFILLLGYFFFNVITCFSRNGFIGRNTSDYLYLGPLCGLIIYAVGALFIPQEKNELTLLGFVMAALLSCSFAKEQGEEKDGTRYQVPYEWLRRSGIVVMFLGAITWACIVSSYVFFALEFVGRHGNGVKESQEPVYVNNAASQAILSGIFTVAGIESPVRLLKDDVAALPKAPAWILWHIAFDSDYQKLRSGLGYATQRKFGRNSSGIAFPGKWWNVPNIQSSVIFLYTGARKLSRNETEELTERALYDNVAPYINVKMLPNGTEYLGAHLLTDSSLDSFVRLAPNQNNIVDFSSADEESLRLGAYKIYLWRYREYEAVNKYSWRVLGSNDAKKWYVIDNKTNIPLKEQTENGTLFEIKEPKEFRYIRFSFVPINANTRQEASISELELYMLPNEN